MKMFHQMAVISALKTSILSIVVLASATFTVLGMGRDSIAKDMPANPLLKTGWSLTMHDEFNGPKLDEKLWIPYYLQHRYKDDVRADYIFRDGCLVLQRKSNGVSSIQTIERTNLHKPGIREVPTKINFEQKYGYFEIRAKSQAGRGNCIAFWLLGTQQDSAQSAEIDIVEQPGHYGNFVGLASLHRWKDVSIAPNTAEKQDFGSKFTSKQDLTKTFNIYALEWTPDQLKYYLNNELILTVPRSPQYKMGVLLSLYQGDKGSWFGPLDKTIPYPKEFVIDYFRAYKKN